MTWSPNPDEMLALRTAIQFSTGRAPAVAGSRWFRDPERRDIQHELPGWPEGPAFTLHTPPQQKARKIGKFIGIIIPLAINIAANLDAASGTLIDMPEHLGTPQEPENEVTDFPVMWAAPETLARTLPWQIDPDRRPKNQHRIFSESYRTEAVVTDQRLVILLSGPHGKNPEPHHIWETKLHHISHADIMTYSSDLRDIRITFHDQSWVRLATSSRWDSQRMAHLLNGKAQVVRETDLTPAQRQSIAQKLAKLPPDALPPICTRLPSGLYCVDITVPSRDSVSSLTIDESGNSQLSQPGDY